MGDEQNWTIILFINVLTNNIKYYFIHTNKNIIFPAIEINVINITTFLKFQKKNTNI